MDPITMIVSAAAVGAAAGAGATAKETIRDAYNAFKRVIIDHYQDYRNLIDSLEILEKRPESSSRRDEFAQELQKAKAAENQALIEAAQTVNAAVEANSPETYKAIGMDIGTLKAKTFKIDSVEPPDKGVAFRAKEVNVEEELHIKNIGGKSDPN